MDFLPGSIFVGGRSDSNAQFFQRLPSVATAPLTVKADREFRLDVY
jgi:hypothetical protein